MWGYTLNQQQISKVDSVRDLGIMQDTDSTVNKALKAVGFVMRTATCFHTIKPIKILYYSIEHSLLV